MKRDGFERDISIEQADNTHIKFVTAPDYPSQPSVIDEAWFDISHFKPNLRHEIARIAFEYGGVNAEERARITKSMLSLYVVLKDANETAVANSKTREVIG